MVVRLAALRTRRTLLPRNIIIFLFLVLISLRGWVSPRPSAVTICQPRIKVCNWVPTLLEQRCVCHLSGNKTLQLLVQLMTTSSDIFQFISRKVQELWLEFQNFIWENCSIRVCGFGGAYEWSRHIDPIWCYICANLIKSLPQFCS
jgi:hypothetical protein